MILGLFILPCVQANAVLFALKIPNPFTSFPWLTVRGALMFFDDRIQRPEGIECGSFCEFVASTPSADSLELLFLKYRELCCPYEVLEKNELFQQVFDSQTLVFEQSDISYKKVYCSSSKQLLSFEYDSQFVKMKISRTGPRLTATCSIDGEPERILVHDREKNEIEHLDASTTLKHTWSTEGEIKYIGIEGEYEISFYGTRKFLSHGIILQGLRVIKQIGSENLYFCNGKPVEPFRINNFVYPLVNNLADTIQIHTEARYQHPVIINSKVKFPFLTDFEPYKWYKEGIFIIQDADFRASLSFVESEWTLSARERSYNEQFLSYFQDYIPPGTMIKTRFTDSILSSSESASLWMRRAKSHCDLNAIQELRIIKIQNFFTYNSAKLINLTKLLHFIQRLPQGVFFSPLNVKFDSKGTPRLAMPYIQTDTKKSLMAERLIDWAVQKQPNEPMRV